MIPLSLVAFPSSPFARRSRSYGPWPMAYYLFLLTLRTVKRAASALFDPDNDPVASRTGFAFPSINVEFALIFPGTTVKVSPVGNGRSPAGNSLFQNASGLAKNLSPLGFAKRGSRPHRRNARAVQYLAGVDVADAGDRFGIHQQNFNVNPALRLALQKFPEVKAAHQIIGQGLLTGMDHPDGGKAAGINEIEVAVSQRDPPSRMRLLLAVRPPEQPS